MEIYWKDINEFSSSPSCLEISSCRLQHFCCGRFSFSVLICKGSGLDLPCLQTGHRSSAGSWEEYENQKQEIRTYLSSSQPNRDLTRKGLKEVFWWMSSTQVLSRCSRFGEVITACWRSCYLSQIMFEYILLWPWMSWNLERPSSLCPCWTPSHSSRCSLPPPHFHHFCKLSSHSALVFF